MERYNAIGMMSGTSLDGLDIAFCSFVRESARWEFAIHNAETIPYSAQWETSLRQAPGLSGKELMDFHFQYGHYLGKQVVDFIRRHKITDPGIIASHGHTVYHRPDTGYTFQAGNGASIAAQTDLTVVCDFRSTDVALGGQGAPLVPIGDHYLFPNFTYCLNLGGFANISFEKQGKRIAFDICPVNFVINKLVREADLSTGQATETVTPSQINEEKLKFDPAGAIAKQGTIDHNLLDQLNAIPFYTSPGPKSLGEEWVNEFFLPLTGKTDLSLQDTLRTIYEHIAIQIAACLCQQQGDTMLITGGGAYNDFLISLIGNKIKPHTTLKIPAPELIDFKEALVFAFLGLLRVLEIPNSLSAVTGSRYDNIGGAVYMGRGVGSRE